MRRISRPALALGAGAVLSVACPAAAVLNLALEDRPLGSRAAELALLLAAGAFPAGAAGFLAAMRIRRGAVLRALAAFVLTTAGLLLFQAAVLGFHFYLNAYGESDGLGTRVGWLQLGFTAAQGAAYYLIFGVPLQLPWALAGPALVGWLVALRDEARPAPP